MGASDDGTSSLSSISTPSSPENPSGRMVNARVGARESIRCCRPDGDGRSCPDGGPPLAILAGAAPPAPHAAFLILVQVTGCECVCGAWDGAGGGEEGKGAEQGIFLGLKRRISRRQWWWWRGAPFFALRLWLSRFPPMAAIFAGDGRPGKQGIFFFELGKQGIGTTSVWDSVGPSGRLWKGTRKTDAQ
jgi:hypothetical protein